MCLTNCSMVLIVHHIDHDRNNGALDNLVWLCHNCHRLVHNYKEEKEKLDVLLKHASA
ncbi:MAG: HNH endonuclease [bacterium]|nr:HNH endonuclease [bacterium]